MKKVRVLICMYGKLVVLALLAAACILFAGCPGQQAPPAAPPGPSPDIEIELGLNDSGAFTCLELREDARDECLKKEASDQSDISKCYLILDNATKEECVYIFSIADPTLCTELTGFRRDQCYVNYANSSSDKQKCKMIVDEVLRAACLNELKGPCEDVDPTGYNRSLCEAIAAHDISKCVNGSAYDAVCSFDYALDVDEKSACDQIADQAYRYACLSILSEDSRYCGSGNTTEQRDMCRILVAHYTGDAAVCQGVSLGTVGQYIYSTQGMVSYVVQCYAEAGITSRNYSACNGPQSGIDRDDCYGLVARGALLPDACALIYSKEPYITGKHDSCYREVAKLMSDPRVCNDIIETITRDRYCYLEITEGIVAIGVPKYNFTLEMCLGITMNYREWSCVGEIAKRTQDSTLCKMIPNDAEFVSTKNECVYSSGGEEELNQSG